MDLEFWATTDVGRVREHNEDNFLVDKRMNLFVVCDGMGGHAAGEVASAMNVQIVREVLSGHRDVFERLKEDPENISNRKLVLTLVEHCISEACARIYQAAQEDPAKKGMGTTCSLLLLAEGRGFIGHVGDSRIYLYRQEQIHQVTEDHSLVNEMIRLGKIKKGEEHNLPHRNAVTRAVGVNEFVEVDTWELEVFSGDSFLLCSDGLSGYFKDDTQIAKLVNQEDLKKITQDCIDFANAGGGKDNITAILVRAGGEESTAEIEQKLDVLRATPYFQYLGYKELAQLLRIAERHEHAAGSTIVAAGSDPGAMSLIIEGAVILKQDGATLSTLEAGDHFGETSLIDETPLNFSVEATEQTSTLLFTRDLFMGLLRTDSALAVKLLWNFLQSFTVRLRGVSPRHLSTQNADSPTPPSGTLAFDQDRREGHQPSTISGEFVGAEAKRVAKAKAKAKLKLKSKPKPKPKPKGPAATKPQQDTPKRIVRAEAKTIPSLRDSGQKAATLDPDKTVPDSGLDGLAWDDIIPPDLLEDEASLRRTAQMVRDADMTGPMSSEDVRETIVPNGNSKNKAISGESMTKSVTPRAQVLKRTKLIVGASSGGELEGREDTRTREVKPLDSAKPDTTQELDIDDDNVEEVN